MDPVLRANHSCTTCRRKKILCDRRTPACTACLKKAASCSYPSSRARYLVSREKSCTQCQRRRMRCDRRMPCSSCQRTGLECGYSGAQPDSGLESNQSNYDGVFARDDRDSDGDGRHETDRSEDQGGIHNYYQVQLLGGSLRTDSTMHALPSVAHIWALYHVYTENVDPLLKLIHLRSFHQHLLRAVDDLANVDAEIEVLLFAIFFAAIVSLNAGECTEKFRSRRLDLLERFRFGLERSLLKLKVLVTPSLETLQALVLYIYAARHAPLSSPLDVLHAIVTRLAMKFNFHQRAMLRPATLFATVAERTEEEMRRRVWWHILALDVQIAESSNQDPTIWEGMWSCRMPGNLDDVELDAFSALPLPPRNGEVFDPDNPYVIESEEVDNFLATYDRRTDMSYSLLQIEMSYAMRQFAFSEHFCNANKYRYMFTVPERLTFLDRHMRSIDHRYLRFCTRNDPFTFFARNAVKLILSRHIMIAQSNDEPRNVLHRAITVLEAAASMRKTHQKWSWSLRLYVELDALELLWKSLASGSLTTSEVEEDNKTIRHAFALGNAAFTRGEEDELHLCYEEKWPRIRAFRDAVMTQRTVEDDLVTSTAS